MSLAMRAACQALRDMLPGHHPEAVRGPSVADGLFEALRGAVRPLEHRRASSRATPPLIEAWVGDRPRSFPLQLKHAGR